MSYARQSELKHVRDERAVEGALTVEEVVEGALTVQEVVEGEVERSSRSRKK